MSKEYQYVNIRETLSRTLRHPMLLDVTLELAILYVLDFIGTFGMPLLYVDKEVEVHIDNYRAQLPCDLIYILQVKDLKTHKCLRSTTDSFAPDDKEFGEPTFRVNRQILFTSFKTGSVLISYKAIPVDDEGYPLLIDNPIYLRCLDAYIKKEAFTVLFDMGKINQAVLQNALQQYAWLAGQLHSEFTIPTLSELESITRSWNTLIERVTEFDRGFKHLGNREYIKLL